MVLHRERSIYLICLKKKIKLEIKNAITDRGPHPAVLTPIDMTEKKATSLLSIWIFPALIVVYCKCFFQLPVLFFILHQSGY